MASITREQIQTYTGNGLAGLTDAQLAVFIEACEARLAHLLCLDSLPATIPADLAMLLANYIVAIHTLNQSGVGGVKRKQVRNFTIEYGNNEPSILNLRQQFSDTIAIYSMCKRAVLFQSIKPTCKNCCPERGVW